ncbi:uncharacterized protein LOC142355706 isoform X2 [Convolutriloba macropyga]|uniref:uncharacterized protein LOC142355706 isoform X2 n=1 Tax=Convolutriloba macropyga TaxID=536237 RepID=UPI003F520B14
MQCSTDLSTLKPELEQLAMKHSEGEGKILELQSQVDLLHKELSLTNERERRKDQLIDLQRSKQERTEAELSSLRQINERQQKEIAVLERSLHSAQDLLGEIELNSVVVNSSSAQGAQNGVNGVNCDSPDKELGNVYGQLRLWIFDDLFCDHPPKSQHLFQPTIYPEFHHSAFHPKCTQSYLFARFRWRTTGQEKCDL